MIDERSFEEQLPSLVGKWKSAGSFPKDFIVVPVLYVSRETIDKQMIRKVIKKLRKAHKVSDGMEQLHTGYDFALDDVEKELKL